MAKTKSKQKPKRAMTGAERQAAYRQRRRQGRFQSDAPEGTDNRQLQAWITTDAFLQLARQARHHGVTKRAMLERVISDGQRKTLDKIKGTPAEDAYWKVFRRRSRVTP
jgi:hypothetical protein